MEMSGKYLTYEEYKALGGTLDITPFNLIEYEARRIIDTYTLNRLKGVESIPDEVKLCEYKMINSVSSYAIDNKTNRNISSENIDGYSVSYVSPTQISEVINSKNEEFRDIITTYLFGVIVNGEHILYIGL